MQNADLRLREIQNKLGTLRGLLSELDKTIVDKNSKDYLLRAASNLLSDVDSILVSHGRKAANPAHASMWLEMAEFQLGQAEKQLKHAQHVVVKYGKDLQMFGG